MLCFRSLVIPGRHNPHALRRTTGEAALPGVPGLLKGHKAHDPARVLVQRGLKRELQLVTNDAAANAFKDEGTRRGGIYL